MCVYGNQTTRAGRSKQDTTIGGGLCHGVSPGTNRPQTGHLGGTNTYFMASACRTYGVVLVCLLCFLCDRSTVSKNRSESAARLMLHKSGCRFNLWLTAPPCAQKNVPLVPYRLTYT